MAGMGSEILIAQEWKIGLSRRVPRIGGTAGVVSRGWNPLPIKCRVRDILSVGGMTDLQGNQGLLLPVAATSGEELDRCGERLTLGA